MYRKRPGTSGLHSNLYETKLLSLLSFRAINDDDIEEFQIASSIDNIQVFDDICFKAKVKGFNKPVAVFIEVKHRKKTLNCDLTNYFNSYLTIRQLFHPSNNDLFFRGTFDETECLFVLYTPAKVDPSHDSVGSGISAKLNDLIDTGGTVKQPYKNENDIELFTKTVVTHEVTSLAKRIAMFITGNNDFSMMLTDEYVLRYHVLLARQVFDVSEIQPEGYRIASFRNDFFDTNEEHLIPFKYTLFNDTLFKDILKMRTRSDMKPMDVSRSTVNNAVELTARDILLFNKFKVPAAFGNKDLTIGGSDAKIEKRINYLASKILGLLNECKSSKMVTIDESLGTGFLQLNGGIAGAIGNIFVLDDATKLMKITDNWELLENFAQKLYKKLRDEHNNLHEYKFCVNVTKFPKLLFDSSEHEKNLARDFLNKLLYFSGQADEKGVEECLKNDIEGNQRDQPNYFQVKTDVLFLKYHDEMQKWWMQPKQNFYLTRNAINEIIQKTSVMNIINEIFMCQIKLYNYTFTEDAQSALNLQDQHSSTVIVAENSVLLTAVKVLQHLNNKNKDHVVLDLEYIATLPKNDQNALRSELKNTNIKTVFILVCHNIDSNKNEKTTLEDIARAVIMSSSVSNIRTIIITDQTSLQIINRCFPKVDAIIYDKKLSLFDVREESQKSILETATAILPGVEIRLDHLLKGWPMTGPR